jgi:hypothetical protein
MPIDTPSYLPALEFLKGYLDSNNAAVDVRDVEENWDISIHSVQDGVNYYGEKLNFSIDTLDTRIRYAIFACEVGIMDAIQVYYSRSDLDYLHPLRNDLGDIRVEHIRYILLMRDDGWKIVDMQHQTDTTCPLVFNGGVPRELLEK